MLLLAPIAVNVFGDRDGKKLSALDENQDRVKQKPAKFIRYFSNGRDRLIHIQDSIEGHRSDRYCQSTLNHDGNQRFKGKKQG